MSFPTHQFATFLFSLLRLSHREQRRSVRRARHCCCSAPVRPRYVLCSPWSWRLASSMAGRILSRRMQAVQYFSVAFLVRDDGPAYSSIYISRGTARTINRNGSPSKPIHSFGDCPATVSLFYTRQMETDWLARRRRPVAISLMQSEEWVSSLLLSLISGSSSSHHAPSISIFGIHLS